jgi:hypothetical protein
MATSMFDQSGRFVSTDPKEAEAFLKATGGQILPSSPAAQRAWELDQQRAVQSQMGMAKGRQAVDALKAQQALNPQTASGLPSDRVVTSDTGFKAVLDAQGNIVGTNAAVSQPIDPRFQGVDAKGDVIAPTAAESALDRREFNQGRGTMLERAALGPNIRDAFLAEYAKTPTREQRIALAKKDGSFASMRDKFNLDAQGSGQVMDEAGSIGPLATMAPGEGVRRRPDMPLGPVAASLINKDYTEAGSPGSLLRRPAGQLEPIFGGQESVGSEMAKAAKGRETEAKVAEAKSRVKVAEDAIRAAQASGKSTPAEIQKLLETYAKESTKADALLLSPEEAQAKAALALNEGMQFDTPGILPKIGTSLEAARLGGLDFWRNAISGPISSGLFGSPTAPQSKKLEEYKLLQENLQRAREAFNQ